MHGKGCRDRGHVQMRKQPEPGRWGTKMCNWAQGDRSGRPVGRLIFIHLQCWVLLSFCRFQRQRCIKIRVLRALDVYTPLALKTAKGQRLPALEVYKSQSPISGYKRAYMKERVEPPPFTGGSPNGGIHHHTQAVKVQIVL